MVDDPRDQKAYQIAIALLGFAAAAALGGIAWVCAEHWCVKNIPNELWFMGAAIGGVFVGALIPFSLRINWRPGEGEAQRYVHDWDPLAVFGCLILVLAFGVTIGLGITEHHHNRHHVAWYAVSVAIGSLLLGLLIPSPGRRDR